jgi:dienelactone hydrolase
VPPLRDAAKPVPLIIYLSGWGGSRANNTALLSALCDAGYAILALDDISQDAPYTAPLDEAARTAPPDYSTAAATQRFVEAGQRKAILQIEKITGLLDKLTKDTTIVPQFATAGVQFNRIGVVGYSFGGATAAELGKRDPRVVAVANMDGAQITPSADQIAMFPYLMINSVEARLTPGYEQMPDGFARNDAFLNDAEDKRQIRQMEARKDAYRLLLRGAGHGDLSDGLGTWRRQLAWLRPGSRSISPGAARRALDAVIVTFLDAHVRQTPSASIPSVLAAHPDLISLGTKPFL